MAEQEGISSYSGKIGEKVGYRRGSKYFERKKTSSYQPSEESLKSASEFGQASKGSALFRKAFKHLFLRSFIPDLHSRLSKILGKVIRSGPIAKKGKRLIIDGDISLFKGFELNTYRSFEDLSPVSFRMEVQDKSIIARLSFVKDIINQVRGDRAKITTGLAWFDFTRQSYSLINSNPIYVTPKTHLNDKSLKIAIPQDGEWTFIMMASICFESNYQSEHFIISENRRYQAGSIVEALHFREGELILYNPDSPSPLTGDKQGESEFDVYWE